MRADRGLLLQPPRVGFARDRQEIEDGLAVARRFQTIEIGKPRRIDLLGFERIEKLRQ